MIDDNKSSLPRWPALLGVVVVARRCWSWAGAAMLWWCIRVAMAFVFMPVALVVHGLRNVGGADPERVDACKTAYDAWSFDKHDHPGFFILALLGSGTGVGIVVSFVKG